jgi:thiol-disulfide isomerase/thioredoxin
MTLSRRLSEPLLILLMAVVVVAGEKGMAQPTASTMPSLDGATEWLNSRALTSAELRGKVVLVDFWTYTCVNWLRTLPYVRAWAEKYKDHGLVVIGVHTPEFEFEKNSANVHRFTRELGVGYPVAVDSDYAIWRAFRNNYWPALYFIDARGNIRHHQFGEGEYEAAERVIQQLLREAGARTVPSDLVSVDAKGAEVSADIADLRSAENYLGYERTNNFASIDESVFGKSHPYSAPSHLRLNHWGLSGQWTVAKKVISLNKPGGRIAYRFHARDVNIVMGPAVGAASVRFRILIDGRPPGEAHGVDVDAQGNGMVSEQRMYQLIRQPQPIVERQVDIEFLDAGAEAFSFTFG